MVELSRAFSVESTKQPAGSRKDFFLSYASSDNAWAEWVAWQLEHAGEGGSENSGFSVELDLWDWQAGENFISRTEKAFTQADRILVLWTEDYFNRPRAQAEWYSAFASHAQANAAGGGPRIIPILVERCSIPELYRTINYVDIVDLDDEAARRRLIEAARGPRRPDGKPPFPGRGAGVGSESTAERPRLPAPPTVWSADLPRRNMQFRGREKELAALREQLRANKTVVLCGTGGVGKTAIAAEYSYRFAETYDLVWWIAAEQPESIAGQLALLAMEVGCGDQSEVMISLRALLSRLRRRRHWLLIFDNAERASSVRAYLPQGEGHIIVSSRSPEWAGTAEKMNIEVFPRAESVQLLQAYVPGMSQVAAEQVAAALGDLPLAVAQAGAYLSATGMPVPGYLHLLETRTGELLAEQVEMDYPLPIAAAWRIAVNRLEAEDATALKILDIAAFLAPEPIPLFIFTYANTDSEQELAQTASDPISLSRAVRAISRYALGRLEGDSLQIHRLHQALLRDRLAPEAREEVRRRAHGLLTSIDLGDPSNPARWPRYSQILPHVVNAEPTTGSDNKLSTLVCEVIRYLYRRGDYRAARELGEKHYSRRRLELGADHPSTLEAATALAAVCSGLGDYQAALEIKEYVLAKRRQFLGDDHISALGAASSLAVELRRLGAVEQARILDADTLARYRRVAGDDHQGTLGAANNLAADMQILGDLAAARALAEDTVTRARSVLGEDHTDTLSFADTLTLVLCDQGYAAAARTLAEDTLSRHRQLQGENHPHTLRSANNLAIILWSLEDAAAARALAEDTLDRYRRVLGEDHPEVHASAETLRRIHPS